MPSCGHQQDQQSPWAHGLSGEAAGQCRAGGWVGTGLPAASSTGTENAAGHVPLHHTNYLSCFPLLPPWADPLLPLLVRQSNHRVWKSWVFRRKQSHDPPGGGVGSLGQSQPEPGRTGHVWGPFEATFKGRWQKRHASGQAVSQCQ